VQVAIKTMEMSDIDNEVTRYLLQCEKEALSSIYSPYVISSYDIVQTDKQCLIITPLCNGGTLKQYIKSKGT
jgi:serine/threonine protein kinase